MRRSTLLLWCGLALTGCSTSPCADFLDHFWPAKPPASAGGSYGGVCNPVPAAPGMAGGPVVPPGLNAPPPGNVITGPPVVPAPAGTGAAPPPATGTPFIPGQSAPPPLSSLPAPDLNGMPTSNPGGGAGNDARPLPPAPATSAPPF